MDITSLPDDIILILTSFLSPSDLVVNRRVCKKWHSLFTEPEFNLYLLQRHYPRSREVRLSKDKDKDKTDWSRVFLHVSQRYHHLKTGTPRSIQQLRLGQAFVGLKWAAVAPWERHLEFEDKMSPFHYVDTSWTYEDGIVVFPSAELRRYTLYDLGARTTANIDFEPEGKIVRRIRLADRVLIIEWCEEDDFDQLNAENEIVFRHFATAYDLIQDSSTGWWSTVFRNEWKIHFLGMALNGNDRYFSTHTSTHYALYLWQPNHSQWGEDDPIESLAVWDISSPSNYRPNLDPAGKHRPREEVAGPRVIKRLSFSDLDFFKVRQRFTPSLRELRLDNGHVYFIMEDHRWIVGDQASYVLPRLHSVKSVGIPFAVGPRWEDECGADEAFPYLTITEAFDIEAGVRFCARHCFMLETISINVKPKLQMMGPGYEVSLSDDMWRQLLFMGKIYGDERWLIGENSNSEVVILQPDTRKFFVITKPINWLLKKRKEKKRKEEREMGYFPAETTVKLPTKDILSWIFDDLPYEVDKPWLALSVNGLKIYYSMIFLGVVGAGGIFAGTNPSYTPFELVHHIKTSHSKFLITEPEMLPAALAAAKECGIPTSKIWIFDVQGQEIPKGFRSWRELMERGERDWVRFDDEKTCRETTAARLFSSGTTGLPKAALLSHYNFIAEHELVNGVVKKPYEIRRLLCLPMFHAAAVPSAHTSALKGGYVSVVMRRFELEPFLAFIEKFEITELLVVPPIIIAIIMSDLNKKYSLKSVRSATSGAAPLGKDAQNKLRNLLPKDATVTQIWGMTETSCIASTFYYPEDDATGSVGKFIPNMDVKLTDDKGNDITAYDTRGELCVRGPVVVSGYFENPQANKESFDSEGFYHTGDILYCDSKTKKWYIVDRKKELIKVRGFQVAPPELESVLISHPLIIDAAVIGVKYPDEINVEHPRAYVVKRPVEASKELNEEKVKKYCGERLAKYKELTGGVQFVDAIPKNASGKILKRVLREMAEADIKKLESKL
ncbi:hypothetical protein B7494_g1160 [Chlorociboria aeruginascens]|nr:hypothetical protein B7494_g1160 [Chlorociboria aeruginascens]